MTMHVSMSREESRDPVCAVHYFTSTEETFSKPAACGIESRASTLFLILVVSTETKVYLCFPPGKTLA